MKRDELLALARVARDYDFDDADQWLLQPRGVEKIKVLADAVLRMDAVILAFRKAHGSFINDGPLCCAAERAARAFFEEVAR